jgi:hypothetical protein
VNCLENLLIVWSSEEVEVAKKLVLLYGSVILPRGYWQEAHIMVWGPSARLIATHAEIQDLVKQVMATGVEMSVCVVCSDEYGVTKELENLGIKATHTGEFLTNALKNDWKVVTF